MSVTRLFMACSNPEAGCPRVLDDHQLAQRDLSHAPSELLDESGVQAGSGRDAWKKQLPSEWSKAFAARLSKNILTVLLVPRFGV